MNSILIVEDDPQMLRALSINLRARNYTVTAVSNGVAALKAAAVSPPDLVILDLGLPDMDGVEVVAGLRGWTTIPIIILSARDAQRDKVNALDVGADDYLTKPFGMDELLARVRAALRRAQPDPQAPVVTTDAFTIDLAAKRASRHGMPVRLTPTEWHLIEVLIRRPGQLVTGSQLLTEVWGPGREKDTNYLRVYMAQLRSKLEHDPSRPLHLITEPGLGYRFEP
jgi:two-component system KDP operon response regulator KdpE